MYEPPVAATTGNRQRGLNYTHGSCYSSGGRKSNTGPVGLKATGVSGGDACPCLSPCLEVLGCLVCGPSCFFKASGTASPWPLFHDSVCFSALPSTCEDPGDCSGPHGEFWKIFPSDDCYSLSPPLPVSSARMLLSGLETRRTRGWSFWGTAPGAGGPQPLLSLMVASLCLWLT